MLDFKFIRENKKLIEKNCANRGVKVDVRQLLSLDEKRRDLIKSIDDLRGERKQKSKDKPDEREIAKLRAVGDKIKILSDKLSAVEQQTAQLAARLPNLTHPQTPIGGEADFKVVYKNFDPPHLTFTPKDHEELMISNDLVDFERATKVAGAKFYYYKNNLVRLNQALLNYGLDMVSKYGYKLLETPDLAKDEILTGVGFNPRGPETQVYSIAEHNLNLIGTAEITVGGYHANEVLDLSKGPLKYAALSHCFRTEAGAYGRTSKGLYRVHQFTKLEMFVFCEPQDSEKYHQEILNIEKEIVDGLELPYRVIDIASGDLGGPAYRKFDIEAWMTMKNDYGEITSCSNCTDYQARRLNIKYRQPDGEAGFVHTLNGSAIPLSRFPLAIVENYQQSDGSIAVPKILRSYCGLKKL